jgi:hypothetical protein
MCGRGLAAEAAALGCLCPTRAALLSEGEGEELQSAQRKFLPALSGYVIAILIGLVVPRVAVVLYFGLAVFLIVPFGEVASLLFRRSSPPPRPGYISRLDPPSRRIRALAGKAIPGRDGLSGLAASHFVGKAQCDATLTLIGGGRCLPSLRLADRDRPKWVMTAVSMWAILVMLRTCPSCWRTCRLTPVEMAAEREVGRR